jgi:hypothetical protein
MMNKILLTIATFLSLQIISCKKNSADNTDTKQFFTGNWAGAQQFTGSSDLYKFSLLINLDNTLVNIDSAFGNQAFPGTYTYTADSLKINYNNGTKWSLKFLNNYTACSGTVLGFAGATATVNMTKK